MTNKYGFMNEEEMKYVQACLEFAVQLGQIADGSLEAAERRRILENEKRKEKAILSIGEQFKNLLDAYLKNIAFQEYNINFHRISYMILNVDLVDDYTSFLINGVTDDENQGVIEIDFNQVPSLESITINHVEVYKREGS